LHLNFQLDVLHRYWKPGTRSGEFGKIGGLAVHGDRLFVADYDNARIQVLELCAPPSG
ncbi:MAG: hypothetical protein GWM98_10010, partial [Nitrospinaceae bacterium]|nr:hypothetical protein [Nitrospinaceae bacterium]NIR54763.1 hypothetical protein [Nitrospinaceae bacterium]NIS85188.1 hypothetical protein [Nitrospinaceae bacterium]NIT81999.1 hypothetical protein [Nitrospinaceae bacterium]NIU44262.1 hypothetical protein [Nitrospinaceae bacterium]